jgi:hypothetical protein
MENYEYKSNSHASKKNPQVTESETKKVEKVVHGGVKTKKKNELTKFASEFISEDIKNVKTYILKDVLVPAIKKGLYDMVTGAIDMALYGGSGRRESRSTASKVSYNSYYNRRDDRRVVDESRTRGCLDYDDIVLTDRRDAEEVLIRMDEIIKKYDIVTVADLFELVGEKGPYTARNYGWTSLHTAEVQRVRDGYLLKLPRAAAID